MTKSIGLIGIGVMGSNIALNFSEKGTSVHVFNQSEAVSYTHLRAHETR